MAGFATAKGIRDIDVRSSLAMVAEEGVPPYDRTALSKSLWQGRDEDDIFFDVADLDVELVHGRVARLERGRRAVALEDGSELAYRKLMLATGARPRRLPVRSPVVRYLRSLADYRAIRRAADDERAFLVLGGGFLGAELAAALAMNGNQVSLVFPEEGVNGRILPTELSLHLNDYFRARGVDVQPGRMLAEVELRQGRLRAHLSDGKALTVDEVVAAVGAEPRLELAREAGLAGHDGILVDESFRADTAGIFASGDVASFPDPVLGRRRVEHEDHALRGGELGGRAMAGEVEAYSHIPLFYSDLFDIGYQAVGLLDSRMRTVAHWEEPLRKGVIHYLDEERRVKGVLMWNWLGKADSAREMIREGTKVSLATAPRSG